MAERVGLSRNITLDWLNSAAGYSVAGVPRDEARAKLEEIIAQRISCADNIRKTRDILLRLWYDSEPWLLESAREACASLAANERVGVHWALLLSQYTLFCDLSAVMGALFDYREEISAAMIRERIYASWGERTTLAHALPKNLQTLRDLGAIIPAAERGWYRSGSIAVRDSRTTRLLLAALLRGTRREYISWEKFILHPSLFPFEFQCVSLADLVGCDHFALERLGGELLIRITTP